MRQVTKTKMKSRSKSNRNFFQRYRIYLLAVLLVLLIGGVVWWRNHHEKACEAKLTPATGATSKVTPPKTTPSSSSTSNRQGGVTDRQGQTSSSTPPASQWAASSNGDITLQQPVNGATINNGDTIKGLAKVDTVQFLLKDDAVGLISQGSLSVIDGKFSGIIHFTPHSKTGKLEIYYPDPSTGAAKDIINIDVNFNI